MSCCKRPECEDLEDVFRLCWLDESDEESCNELPGEVESATSFNFEFVSKPTFCDLAESGDWYGELINISSRRNGPGESWGIAELKKWSPSCIASVISVSNICGGLKLGRDGGNGSLPESIAAKRSRR